MIIFHRFLITAGILFCASYAGWALSAYRTSRSTTQLVLGVVFIILAAALAYYLKNLRKFLYR
jgi:hypothetical protein